MTAAGVGVSIVGVAESELGVASSTNELQLHAQAARGALAEAGLTTRDVDGLFTAANDLSWIPSVLVAEYLGIDPKVSDSTNIGGASFEAHVGHAAAAIAAGHCEVALITYGSTQRSRRARSLGASGPVRLTEQFERPYGLPLPVGAYALAARRHMHLHGTTSEQLAEVAVAARAWAALNPRAYARDPLTIAAVLESPWIVEPLHLLDCCLVTDGGGAVVLTSDTVARSLRQPPVRVIGHGAAHTHATISNMPDLTVPSAAASGARAFAMAGVTPGDIDVAEIYDSFTITPMLSLEALGFCAPGESGAFVSGGRIAPGGAFPMNTNGGGLSYCHPGMFGIFLLIEAARQLRGECDARQVAGARLAIAHGTGGALASSATVILGGSLMAGPDRPFPVPDGDSQPYWRAAAAGRLELQRCAGCGRVLFYPRSVCPHCMSDQLGWEAVSGRATVYSYAVVHRAPAEFRDEVPYAVALVDLEEGVRMMTRIVECTPSDVYIGQKVDVTFLPISDGVSLPCFRPAATG